MELIMLLLVSYYLANNLVTNTAYAVRGLDPPRHKERMARLEHGGQAPAGGYRSGRHGASRFFAEAWHDAWDDAHDKRRELRERRRTRRAEQYTPPVVVVEPDAQPDGEVDTPEALRPQEGGEGDSNVIPLATRTRRTGSAGARSETSTPAPPATAESGSDGGDRPSGGANTRQDGSTTAAAGPSTCLMCQQAPRSRGRLVCASCDRKNSPACFGCGDAYKDRYDHLFGTTDGRGIVQEAYGVALCPDCIQEHRCRICGVSADPLRAIGGPDGMPWGICESCFQRELAALDTPEALRPAPDRDSETRPDTAERSAREQVDETATEPSHRSERPNERPTADEGGPAEPKESQEGTHMPSMTTSNGTGQPAGETAGLGAAIRFAASMANSLRDAASRTETSIASLTSSEVGELPLAALHQAMELTVNAANQFEFTQTELEKQLSVKDAYAANPDAGNKKFLLSD